MTAQEYAVLDRVGRLQLPREFVEALGLRQRVRVELVDDHIEIWPQAPPPPAQTHAGTGPREEEVR